MPPVLVPLDYNPYWVDRNLTNRRSTEALLAPERDAGNVSPNDYEAAVEFSASPHRFYRVRHSLSFLSHANPLISSLAAS